MDPQLIALCLLFLTRLSDAIEVEQADGNDVVSPNCIIRNQTNVETTVPKCQGKKCKQHNTKAELVCPITGNSVEYRFVDNDGRLLEQQENRVVCIKQNNGILRWKNRKIKCSTVCLRKTVSEKGAMMLSFLNYFKVSFLHNLIQFRNNIENCSHEYCPSSNVSYVFFSNILCHNGFKPIVSFGTIECKHGSWRTQPAAKPCIPVNTCANNFSRALKPTVSNDCDKFVCKMHTKASITCAVGYMVSSPGTITCSPTGDGDNTEWKPIPGECLKACSLRHLKFLHSLVPNSSGAECKDGWCKSNGYTEPLRCRKGYVNVFENRTDANVSRALCMTGGVWKIENEHIMKCRKTCQLLSKYDSNYNGSMGTQIYAVGSSVYLSCKGGFQLEGGRVTVRCNELGRWEPWPKKCIGICPSISSKSKIIKIDAISGKCNELSCEEHSTVQIRCFGLSKHHLSTIKFLKCMSSGLWMSLNDGKVYKDDIIALIDPCGENVEQETEKSHITSTEKLDETSHIYDASKLPEVLSHSTDTSKPVAIFEENEQSEAETNPISSTESGKATRDTIENSKFHTLPYEIKHERFRILNTKTGIALLVMTVLLSIGMLLGVSFHIYKTIEKNRASRDDEDNEDVGTDSRGPVSKTSTQTTTTTVTTDKQSVASSKLSKSVWETETECTVSGKARANSSRATLPMKTSKSVESRVRNRSPATIKSLQKAQKGKSGISVVSGNTYQNLYPEHE